MNLIPFDVERYDIERREFDKHFNPMTNKPEWAESWEGRWNRLTVYPNGANSSFMRSWLKSNNTLFTDYPYPESLAELDEDKVKAFIASELKLQKELLLQRIEEGLPKQMVSPGKGTTNFTYPEDGFNDCLDEVLELLRKME